jgi:hypothetical protein
VERTAYDERWRDDCSGQYVHFILWPLHATDPPIREITALLETDVKVLDWEELHRRRAASFGRLDVPDNTLFFCMFLPHARTGGHHGNGDSVDMLIRLERMRVSSNRCAYALLHRGALRAATDYWRINGASRARKRSASPNANPRGRDGRRVHRDRWPLEAKLICGCASVCSLTSTHFAVSLPSLKTEFVVLLV